MNRAAQQLGVMSGMTDHVEKRILDALNNEQPKLEQ